MSAPTREKTRRKPLYLTVKISQKTPFSKLPKVRIRNRTPNYFGLFFSDSGFGKLLTWGPVKSVIQYLFKYYIKFKPWRTGRSWAGRTAALRTNGRHRPGAVMFASTVANTACHFRDLSRFVISYIFICFHTCFFLIF